MAVPVVADLAIEVVHGTVAEITSGESVAYIHTLVGVVVAVGRGKAAVGIHVVVSAIGVVRDEFQALCNAESQAVGQREGIADAGVLIGVVSPDAAAAAEERRGGSVHIARLNVHGAVGIEGNVEGADILCRVPKDTRVHKAGLSVLLPETTVVVVGALEGYIAGIVQPRGNFRI